MKVLAGTLTDNDRQMIFESNTTGRRVLVHTDHYCPVRGHSHTECGGADCMVGVVLSWNYESFHIGSPSGTFVTNIPWKSARLVRWRDEVDDSQPCPIPTCAYNLRKASEAVAS
jgi:hypothetical protein